MNSQSLFNQSYFSEAMNGLIFILGLFAVGVFARWLWINRRDGYQEVRSALAVSALFCGETIIRFSFWLARHLTNIGYEPNETAFYTAVVIGGGIQAWGMLCCMKVFSPEHCSAKVWIYAPLCAIAWNIFWMASYFF